MLKVSPLLQAGIDECVTLCECKTPQTTVSAFECQIHLFSGVEPSVSKKQPLSHEATSSP